MRPILTVMLPATLAVVMLGVGLTLATINSVVALVTLRRWWSSCR